MGPPAMPRATPFTTADIRERGAIPVRLPTIPADALAKLAEDAGVPEECVSAFAEAFLFLRGRYWTYRKADEQETPARVAASLGTISRRLSAFAELVEKSREFKNLKRTLIDAPASMQKAVFAPRGRRDLMASYEMVIIPRLPEYLRHAAEIGLAAAEVSQEKDQATSPDNARFAPKAAGARSTANCDSSRLLGGPHPPGEGRLATLSSPPVPLACRRRSRRPAQIRGAHAVRMTRTARTVQDLG